MSNRQRTILRLLKGHDSLTTYGLRAWGLEAPDASIRRDIGILRRQGWRIEVDRYGAYRLSDAHV
jgi:predicted DNA-binding transcriptional regulator YafY